MKAANKKLGDLLIQEEVITREQLREALRERESAGGFLGETMVRLNLISEDELIGFLVRQCRIPHLKIANFQISHEIAELIPAEICVKHRLLPIDKLGSLLTVAMVNPLDVDGLEKVKNTVKLRIKPILCSWADFKVQYERIYSSLDEEIGAAQLDPRDSLKGSAAKSSEKVETTPREPKSPDVKGEDISPREDGLIERFVFENFVVAEANSFTYALARSIAESPGSEYNPFFVYGNTGLGKTHLSNAIGNEIVAKNNKVELVYAPASRFIDEMLDAVEHDQMKEFRERYGRVDVLILDDVQFLAGRTRAQQEFFNIFNVIYNNRKQIILVSDVTPKDLEGLEQRLISRFEGGVVACMEEPDLETRLAILRQRTESVGADVPDDVLELLATSIQSNIRELEGALKKLLAYSSLVGHEISVELAQEILKHLFKEAGA